ncbi:hypothetical protein ABTM99_20375, partial [Acinetobacter baumannii]
LLDASLPVLAFQALSVCTLEYSPPVKRFPPRRPALIGQGVIKPRRQLLVVGSHRPPAREVPCRAELQGFDKTARLRS